MFSDTSLSTNTSLQYYQDDPTIRCHKQHNDNTNIDYTTQCGYDRSVQT